MEAFFFEFKELLEEKAESAPKSAAVSAPKFAPWTRPIKRRKQITNCSLNVIKKQDLHLKLWFSCELKTQVVV